MSIREGQPRRRGAEPDPHHAPRLPVTDQAAGDRAAARHHDSRDAACRPRHRRPAADPQHPGRRPAGGGGRQHAELRRRRGHRQGDEADRAPAARPGHCAAQPCAGVRAGCRSARSSGCGGRRTCSPAHLAVATIVFYVLVYTLVLKRRTSQNVVWGGAAGCMPVMIGWSAVTGTIGWPALVMFLMIFFWTPPHTWALAMRYKEDYQAAGVPMLPAVATERQVTKQILVYTWLTVLATLALALATGWLYAVGRHARRRLVPGDGPPAVRRGAARRTREAAATVPAVEQLPRRRLLRARGRLGAWRCRLCLQPEPPSSSTVCSVVARFRLISRHGVTFDACRK